MTSPATPDVVLLGPMRVGKSTIAAAVAQRTGLLLVDGDAVLEGQEGRTAAVVAAQQDVPALHRLECEIVLATLARPEPTAVAAAASVTDSPAVLATLVGCGAVVVALAGDVDVLLARAGEDDHRRPVADLAGLVTRRDVTRATVAHAVLDTTKLTVERTTAAVLAAITERSR